MADSKITALTALGAAPATGDLFVVVDISDTTMSANGTNKKITAANLLSGVLTATGTVTGATSQAQAFTSGITAGNGTSGSVTINASSDQLIIQRSGTRRASWSAFDTTLDIDHSPDGTASSLIRFMRNTNTSGTKQILFLAGTDSTTVVHQIGVNTATVWNEQGSDLDFRIEGDTDQNLFFVDASTDRVGIGTATPAAKFDVAGAARAQTVAATNTGEAMALGGSNTNTYVNIAGTRSYFGYDGAAVIVQGGTSKGINFAVNNATFGSGVAASIDTSGNFTVISGVASATTLSASGDSGGSASTNRFTNVSDLSANSSGTGTVAMKGTTSRNSSGFIKIYIGTIAYYIPVWSAITG